MDHDAVIDLDLVGEAPAEPIGGPAGRRRTARRPARSVRGRHWWVAAVTAAALLVPAGAATPPGRAGWRS